MGNIVASYKYLRKSPCEAKASFFECASSFSASFLVDRQTLLFLVKNFGMHNFDEDYALGPKSFGNRCLKFVWVMLSYTDYYAIGFLHPLYFLPV